MSTLMWKPIPIEELKEKILNQEIEDSKTIAAILAYDAKYHAE